MRHSNTALRVMCIAILIISILLIIATAVVPAFADEASSSDAIVETASSSDMSFYIMDQPIAWNSASEDPLIPVVEECEQHDYKEYVETPATCTTEGTLIKFCVICGKTITETIPCIDHTLEIIPAVEPTCTEPGATEGSICSICGLVIVQPEDIAPLGHTYGEFIVIQEPTETEEGSMIAYCTRCGEEKVVSIPKVIPVENVQEIDETIPTPTITPYAVTPTPASTSIHNEEVEQIGVISEEIETASVAPKTGDTAPIGLYIFAALFFALLFYILIVCFILF